MDQRENRTKFCYFVILLFWWIKNKITKSFVILLLCSTNNRWKHIAFWQGNLAIQPNVMDVTCSEIPSGFWDYDKRGLPKSTTTESQTIHLALLIQVTQVSQLPANPRATDNRMNYVYYNERGTFKTIGKPYVFEHCRGMQNQIVSWESLW